LEIETQSIARALVKNEISLSPVLLIDFGKSATIFIIYSGCCLRFASTIPISSQHLTQAISKNMEIDLVEAEKLKLKYNLKTLEEGGKIEKKNIKNKKLFEAMIPVLSDMIGQIKRCVSYYHTHGTHEHLGSNGKKLEKIILCGKGANLEGLADFLSASLKIPVEIGNPWINILPEPLKEVPELSFKDSLGYTTALGLALRGIRESN
jgi:Tfp pilus assembly PilM family ATPase